MPDTFKPYRKGFCQTGMKILVTCLSKAWGGMEMFALSSIKLLIEDGYNVTAACIDGSPLHAELKKSGIKQETFKPALFSSHNLLKFVKIFRKKGYNLLHTHFSKDLWLIVPAVKITRCQIPVVLTKHLGSAVSKKDYLHNMIYKRVDYAIAISNVIKQNLLDTTCLTSEKVILLNNYIDLSRFGKNEKSREKLLKEFSIPPGVLTMGVVARITPGKGHEEVVEAVKKISSQNFEFKVFIVGASSPDEADYEKGLKEKVKKYGLDKYFVFTGFRSDIPELMSMFDIFLFPSRAEAFGLSLLEAMAAGLPSIVCFSDGVKDIAVENQTSLTFDRQNYELLAKHIKKLILDKALREKLGAKSLERARRFSPRIFQEKINLLYELAILRQTNINDYINELIENPPDSKEDRIFVN